MTNHQDIRDGVTAICADFPGSCRQETDAKRACPTAFVNAPGAAGFATEYDIERKLRETRLYQVAPVSTNLILSCIGEHVLDMPRSF